MGKQNFRAFLLADLRVLLKIGPVREQLGTTYLLHTYAYNRSVEEMQ